MALSTNSNCLQVTVGQNREELIRKWISRRFVILKMSSSRTASRGSECRLKVERVLNSNSKTTKMRLGAKGQFNQVSNQTVGKKTSSLLLSSGRRGSIRYNDEFIGIKCVRGGRNNYEVELFVDNNSGGISTALSLVKGQKIDIGQIIDEKKASSDSVGLNRGVKVGLSRDERKQRFTYFLMID